MLNIGPLRTKYSEGDIEIGPQRTNDGPHKTNYSSGYFYIDPRKPTIPYVGIAPPQAQLKLAIPREILTSSGVNAPTLKIGYGPFPTPL